MINLQTAYYVYPSNGPAAVAHVNAIDRLGTYADGKARFASFVVLSCLFLLLDEMKKSATLTDVSIPSQSQSGGK